MSLINSVLRDLDKRRADASGVVPNEVRPLPEGQRELPVRTIGVGVLLVALAAVAWLAQPLLKEAPPSSPVATRVPDAVPPAPTPVPPAPTPVPPAPAVAPPGPTPAPLAPVAPAVPAPVGALKLDASLDHLPSSPPREKPKETKKADKVEAKPAPRPEPVSAPAPLAARAEPAPAVPRSPPASTPVSPPAEPAAPKPAKPGVVEDDWTRAQALLRENRGADAEPLLRQVLQKNPGQTPARQALVGLLLPARRHAEAIEVLREGQALSPEQTGWAMNLARLQADRNDYAAAWDTLSRSLPHAQQQADFLAFCGTVLQRLNRAGEAVTYYQGALRIKPQEGRWWVGLGIALEAERKPAEAREAYRQAKASGALTPELAGFVDQKLR